MSIWILLLIIVGAGAVGGLVNAVMTSNGFVLPKSEDTEGGTILRPGFLGNVLIGGIAAGVSWGLYGPLANAIIFPTGAVNTTGVNIALATLVGAVLVGIGGARWLTNEVDKKLLKAAAAKAASSPHSDHAAKKIALASPLDALNIAKSMH
jgi:hypothetical protein